MLKENNTVMEIDLDIDGDWEEIDLKFELHNDINLQFESGIQGTGGTNDYRKLKNKPKINGAELYDNYEEIDPNVPEYIKEGKGVNGEDTLSIVQIADIFNIYFGI